MKTKNKALLLALCAVSLVTASVFGTMAYLTDKKTVTNTFTVGSVAITMDETDVDLAGQKDSDVRVQQNTYKLLPGHTYVKDPQIHVDPTSEDCYLFVKVENGIAAIEAADATVESQMTENGWVAVTGHDGVYVYVGTAAGASDPLAVSAKDDIDVFDEIKIDGSVDKTKLDQCKNANITVTAYAVQKDGFAGKSAAEIWTAAAFN